MQEQDKGRVERRGGHQGLLLSSVVVAATMLAAPARAQITFSFNYTDAAGVGFNAADPLGASRRAALEKTGILLSNLFPIYTATITMDVNGSETDDSTLAAAGSNFNAPAAVNCVAGYDRGDVGIKVLGGADPAPAAADGSVTVNFEDVMWDLDDNVDPARFDFKSTMLHELLHAMGFANSVTLAGTDACGNAAPSAGGWVPYDEHLGNTMTSFIDKNFVITPASWTAAVTGGTGNAGVLWRGTNAMAANGGSPVPLFSPTTFLPGSSVAHLDDDFFTSTEFLMEQAADVGPGARTLSNIELGMMRDIGFASRRTGSKGFMNAIYLLLLNE